VRDRAAKVRSSIDTIASDLRRFSRDLRPSILDDLGLAAAVEWLVEDLNARSTIATTVEVTGRPRRLDAETELGLFRIAQEALRNVEKHAAARSLLVQLGFATTTVHLVVTDNGVGFDPEPSSRDLIASGQLGLAGMQERAQLLGAELAVDSQLGRGSTVRLTLPTTSSRVADASGVPQSPGRSPPRHNGGIVDSDVHQSKDRQPSRVTRYRPSSAPAKLPGLR
jgi:signal transduction histidine kinase